MKYSCLIDMSRPTAPPSAGHLMDNTCLSQSRTISTVTVDFISRTREYWPHVCLALEDLTCASENVRIYTQGTISTQSFEDEFGDTVFFESPSTQSLSPTHVTPPTALMNGTATFE